MDISDVQLPICVQIMVEFLMQIDHRSSKSNFRTRLLRRDSWYSKSVLERTPVFLTLSIEFSNTTLSKSLDPQPCRPQHTSDLDNHSIEFY